MITPEFMQDILTCFHQNYFNWFSIVKPDRKYQILYPSV